MLNRMMVTRRAIPAWVVAGCAALAFLTLPMAPAMAEGDQPLLAIATFSFKDTSGEARDQTAEHRAKLDMITGLIREAVKRAGDFAIVGVECQGAECAVEDGVAPPALVESAAKAGARYLVVGGVQKMSTLIQLARVNLLDLTQRKAVFDRSYTFRGDTEDAWRHAALFVVRQLNEQLLQK
jgi:hypothetical protein